MLALEGIEVRYGGLVALRGVSLHVGQGEFVAVIGPNGAGKTTLFKAISGVVPLAAGSISLDGEPIGGLSASARPHRGIAHVPEGRQVFGDLTVEENLQLGTVALRDRGDGSRGRGRRAVARSIDRRAVARSIERSYALFPILRERRHQQAGSLSGGQQQMLAIGRGLASSPRLLMLDEPSMGLAPAIVDTIFEAVHRLNREERLTVLIVEQRAIEAIEICDRGYVLSTGEVVLRGTRAELLADTGIRRAYLGA